MFGPKHYVPALKWRQGEQLALRALDASDKSKMTPLIEVTPITGLGEDPVTSALIEEHLYKLPDDLAKNWGTDAPVFLDFGLLDFSAGMKSGRHVVEEMSERVAGVGVHAVPVLGVDSSDEVRRACKKAASRESEGICIRIQSDDLYSADLEKDLATLLAAAGASLDQTDLILDVGSIDLHSTSAVVVAMRGVINSIPDIKDFRTLTFLSGAFPVNLTDFEAFTVGEVPRADWLAWRKLLSLKPMRLPAFGDYGARHPVFVEGDKLMTPSASIRYTTADAWKIYRGRRWLDVRYGGAQQYQQLSSQLVNSPDYTGDTFSWGDAYIKECAGGGKTGNPPIWVRVAQSHHITFASRQVATTP